MRALSLVFVAMLVAGCRLPANVYFQCEADGGCAVAGTVCMSDGVCRPPEDAGAADAGTDAGRDAGTNDAGAGDAGCVPRDLTAACAAVECGFVDDGCGGEVSCDKWCPGPQLCGVNQPNTCALPSLCTPDGWCWEYPLPQGLTLNASFRLDARHTWFVGEHGVILFFDGEQLSLQQAPGVDGAQLASVHGTALDEVFAVGATGVLLHFDGTKWEREGVTSAFASHLRAVWSLGGGRALAVGPGGRVLSRDPNAPADKRWVLEPFPTTGAGDLREVLTDDEGRAYIASFNSELFTRPAGSVTNWTKLDDIPLTGTLAVAATGDGLLFGGGSAQGASLVMRRPDGGWQVMSDAGLVVTELVRADGGVFALGGGELGWVADDGAFHRFGTQGGQWNTGVPLDGPRILTGGSFGGMALLSTDGGAARLSSPRVLLGQDWNAICGHGPGGVYVIGGSEGTACAACQVQWIERSLTSAGVDWRPRSLRLGNTTALRGCLSESPTRTWFTGNDSKYVARNSAGDAVAGDFVIGGDFTSLWGQPDAGYLFTRMGESTLAGPSDWASSLSLQNLNSTAPLRAVWGTGGREVVAVGNRAILRGASVVGPWVSSTVNANLVAVHGAALSSTTTRVVAAGDAVAWSLRTGETEQLSDFNTDWALRAVWVSRTGSAWAGGMAADGGAVLLRSDLGGMWTTEALSSPRELRGVFGLDLDDGGVTLFIVGPGGMVLRR